MMVNCSNEPFSHGDTMNPTVDVTFDILDKVIPFLLLLYSFILIVCFFFLLLVFFFSGFYFSHKGAGQLLKSFYKKGFRSWSLLLLSLLLLIDIGYKDFIVTRFVAVLDVDEDD